MIVEALERHARERAAAVAVAGDHDTLDYSQLYERVTALSAWLQDQQVSTLGIHIDNCPDWIIADLAGIDARVRIVPIPSYFTISQVAHLIETAAIEYIMEPTGESAPGLIDAGIRKTGQEAVVGEGCKITFTSGSTGTPKGVVLEHEKLALIATSIVTAMEQIDVEKHLCLLPLATLLENVAGVYAPILKGIEISVPSPAMTGLEGSSGLDVGKFASCLESHQPHSLIVVPQLLMAITTLAELDMLNPACLRMVAVARCRVQSRVVVGMTNS